MAVEDRDWERLIAALRSDDLPLAVIGGGIYGAATAWQAASRGISVVLLEREDFCGTTSANSLKIIHGGLRYLQNLDLPRAIESAREQKLLREMAGHLVRPLEFVAPTYPELTRGRLAMGAGLLSYAALKRLSGTAVPGDHWGRIFDLGELRRRLPGFSDLRVTGGVCWRDAQAVNTERLVMAFVMSAIHAGARAFNYAEAVRIETGSDRVRTIAIVDVLSRQQVELPVSAVVDCTGPAQGYAEWSRGAAPDLIRATNFVVGRPLAPVAVGFRSIAAAEGDKDLRLLFATPWAGSGIIGTWYSASDSTIGVDEVESALAQVNRVFPHADLRHRDVTMIHQGWLPAVRRGTTLQLADRPAIRHAAEHGGPHGLFYVQGVKYTTARAVAEQAVEQVAAACGLRLQPRISRIVRLYGAPGRNSARYEAACLERFSGRFGAETVRRLVANYGVNIKPMLAAIESDNALAAPIPGAMATIRAEIEFVLEREYVVTLSDLMLRRTDLGSHGLPQPESISYCADQMAARMNWDAEERQRNIRELLSHYPPWSLDDRWKMTNM